MPQIRDDLRERLCEVRSYSRGWYVVEITDVCPRARDTTKFLVYDRTANGTLCVGFVTGPFAPEAGLMLHRVMDWDGIDTRSRRVEGVTDEFPVWLEATGLTSIELADLIFSCPKLAANAA
ncbi:hypothetical protein COV06_01390 [Candidatus Uhrbacteria bacterium CG10_big_fil_rev_8_21_14_0_10_50_16]|uniref:Uncharacterized protein n=1 Tax=Candidatus Uhrbacteria bacterium CG10_big_fil_rev_8_21_14_0_10_50_16 TaxID=1975039 RepID=A0A2H0RPX4_9BACT|nr:MAG: hypothetical protein COV06_01390 [Candidatus Uhrbacteria bacterium CG10_big_fil_rev_8_21_14_0_10_50_16]